MSSTSSMILEEAFIRLGELESGERPRPKRTRASRPKVKTGCMSCRQRRVKCDETRPSCLRCLKYTGVCDGYRLDPVPGAYRSLLGRNNMSMVIAKRKLQTVTVTPISTSLFRSEEEHHYFQLFCTETAYHLTGYQNPALWSNLVLQASDSESSIRHGVIALGALGMTTRTTGEEDSFPVKSNQELSKHHHFALQQYNEAVSEMRKSLAEGKQDLRTTLLCSLLIICYENYHGHYQTALAQVHTGLKLLDDWKAKQHSSRIGALISPTRDIVEDELVLVFNRLDIQAMTHTDCDTLETHIRLKDQGATTIATMPEAFDSILEGSKYGKLVMCCNAHFMTMAWIYDIKNPTRPLPGTAIMDRIRYGPTEEGIREQQKHLSYLERWHDAFRPIWCRSRTPHGSSWRNGANCIELHYKAMIFCLHACFMTEQCDSDRYTPMFVEMLSLARPLLEDNSASFTFDYRAIFCMDLVARKCRDPSVRREAIRLLRLKPRREGFWDSVVSVKVCQWLMDTEEEGIEDGYIPEHARLRQVKTKYDWENKTARVWGEVPVKGGKSGEIVVKETMIEW